MKPDKVTQLLHKVARGDVSVEDARTALSDVSLSEEDYKQAVEHGVFDKPEAGAIVRATLAPSGESLLVLLVFIWGLGFTLFWSGSMTYGLFAGWDQQQLSFHLGMTLVTLIIMGIVYLRWVLPDLEVVKYRRAKYIPPKDPEDWVEYKF